MIMFYHITHTAFMTSDLLSMTSHPLFRTSHHFMYDIKSTVSDLTSPISVSSHPSYRWHHSHYMSVSHPLYLWHHIPYIYDIISTKYDGRTLCVDDPTLGICATSFALQMTSYPFYHTNQSIYHVTCTSGMLSRTLYQTLHPLYLCHHNLSADITPSFEWHHTHFLCDIICTMYNVTSIFYVITLLYLWHQNLYIWNHI